MQVNVLLIKLKVVLSLKDIKFTKNNKVEVEAKLKYTWDTKRKFFLKLALFYHNHCVGAGEMVQAEGGAHPEAGRARREPDPAAVLQVGR